MTTDKWANPFHVHGVMTHRLIQRFMTELGGPPSIRSLPRVFPRASEAIVIMTGIVNLCEGFGECLAQMQSDEPDQHAAFLRALEDE